MADEPTPAATAAHPLPRKGGAYHRLADGSLRRDPETRGQPKPRRKAEGEAPGAPTDAVTHPVTEA